MIRGIKTNFPLILRGGLSGIFLMLGPLLAMLVRFGNANMGIIITVGLIFEALGLGGFWLLIRNDYQTKQEVEDREEAPLHKLREKIFHPKSEKSEKSEE